MRRHTAAAAAQRLLARASRHLGTDNPVPTVGVALEESLPAPPGDDYYHRERAFEPSFAETDDHSLAFVLTPGGPQAGGADRVALATKWVRQLSDAYFGPQAAHWFDARSEAARGGRGCGCAWFGSGFDRDGLKEAAVTYQWSPHLGEALPPTLFRLVRTVTDTAPGLVPAFTTVRCGRSSGSQQVTFDVTRPLPLADLKPLMDQFGLGDKHASLVSATAFILGARFTLPADVATVTLRPTRGGVELRLDVNLDALPDTPTQLLSLLRLQMTERPAGLRALDRWLMAVTPDGFDGPGQMTVLSVRVRPDMPARVALYLRPTALEQSAEPTPTPAVAAR